VAVEEAKKVFKDEAAGGEESKSMKKGGSISSVAIGSVTSKNASIKSKK
jgi:hypothetical protein